MKLEDMTAIKQMAKELGLKRYRNAENAIREYCVNKVEELIKPFKSINNLDGFLEIVSSGLGVKFEHIGEDDDLKELISRFASQGEIAFVELYSQLDNETDAVLIRLMRLKQWKYVAVIDCRGHKKFKAYFSKWHELAHVLTMSPQASFQFRRTPAIKKEPTEQMVDRVAGDLAFYSPLFLPELLALIKIDGRLSFDSIENLRIRICPSASREATIRAAVKRCPLPQLLIIADYGLKKQAERLIASEQEELFPFKPDLSSLKIRAIDVIGNAEATKSGLWIYRNMEVPTESIITELYDNTSSDESVLKTENLDWWKHSRGQLKTMSIQVEARKIGRRVLALLSSV